MYNHSATQLPFWERLHDSYCYDSHYELAALVIELGHYKITLYHYSKQHNNSSKTTELHKGLAWLK